MNPLDLFPNPDEIGQCEYRVIYDALKDTLADCPQDERTELAMAMLDEFKGWADAMRNTMKRSSKKAKSKG